ncbi:MAG: FecR domain-containing protein [Desulfobacteraceae bacterium]|nr:FecR domain-containing protein [Desulfobacteraceae bacterium]
MKKTIIFLKNLGFIVFAVFLTSTAYCSVGKVAAIRGEAYSHNSGITKQLFIKSEIFLNDTIETRKNSRLQILFNDETIASLGPESTITVKNYQWSEKEQQFEAEAREGLFHIMGGKIVNSAPEKFKIKTPVASIGIRGSMFAFKVNEKNLDIVFLGGKGIDIDTDFGRTSLIKPGFGTRIDGDKKTIEPPRKYSEKEIGAFKKSLDSNQKNDSSPPDEEKDNGEKNSKAEDSDQQSVKPEANELEYSEIYADINQDKIEESLESEKPTEPEENDPFLYPDGKFLGSAFINHNVSDNENFRYSGTAQGEFKDFLKITEKDSTGNIISYNEFKNFKYPDGKAQYSKPVLNADSPSFDFTIRAFSQTFDLKADITTSPLHEFYLVHVPPQTLSIDNLDYVYTSTSFFGTEPDSSNYPDNLFYKYNGHFTASTSTFFESNEYIEAISGGITIGANFTNKRIIGTFINDSPHEYRDTGILFFGTIAEDSKTIKDITLVGTKVSDNDRFDYPEGFPGIFSVSSQSNTGSFFGTIYQGAGITIYADLKDMNTMTETGSAVITMGGFKNDDYHDINSSPDFNNLKGFVIGISENINSPDSERKFFMNASSEDFFININKSEGTISGKLNAYDYYQNQSISNLSFGGTKSSSVYVDDKAFAAIIDSSTQSVTSDLTGNKSEINKDTGFLSSLDSNQFESEYITWGYWEASYKNPDDNSQTYHIHGPGSFFIAGQKTPETTNILQETGQQTLSYEGKTNTVVLNDFTRKDFLQDGHFNMSVFSDNGNYSIQAKIQPDINNTQLIFNYTGSVSGNEGFYGYMNSDFTGYLNGDFFGPKAEECGGNFNAELNSEKYFGIFTGKR